MSNTDRIIELVTSCDKPNQKLALVMAQNLKDTEKAEVFCAYMNHIQDRFEFKNCGIIPGYEESQIEVTSKSFTVCLRFLMDPDKLIQCPETAADNGICEILHIFDTERRVSRKESPEIRIEMPMRPKTFRRFSRDRQPTNLEIKKEQYKYKYMMGLISEKDLYFGGSNGL